MTLPFPSPASAILLARLFLLGSITLGAVHAFAPANHHCHHYHHHHRLPNAPSNPSDAPLSRIQLSSKQTEPRNASNPSRRGSKSKPKAAHDRTIDRRKSPALWRYDLEYSIAPAMNKHDMQKSNNPQQQQQQQQSNEFFPTEPPELMSPAGGWPQLKAAVANGADAVYLGLTSYSARARAANFDPDPTLLYYNRNNNNNNNNHPETKHFEDKLEAARSGGTAKRPPKKAQIKKDTKTKSNAKNTENPSQYEPTEGQPASLAHAVQFCHQHHVRVYVAFNTLVFDDELHEVQSLIEQVWDCGADAVIVQDVGVAKIVEEVVRRLMTSKVGATGRGLNGAPLEIHASTQQTVTCADGVSFAAERTNATRVVVGRELSLAEIAQISTNTDTEIEAFVHGALCVSYSGQCFSSEAWGGRSANRGQCAQACRLPYGLVANGALEHLSFDGIEGIMGKRAGGGSGGGGGRHNGGGEDEEIQYLLSPQDLCGLEQVEGLCRAGVSCLKIEGRLKDASYVAATTRAYRQAIDEAWNKLLEERNTSASVHATSTPQRILSYHDDRVSRSDLTHVFARGQDEEHDGLTPGFFEGPQHQRLVRGRSPRHRGSHVGRVLSSNRGALVVKIDDHLLDQASSPLKRGDGIVVDRGMPQEQELGGPIYDVMYEEGHAILRFGRDVERQWKENDKRSSTIMAPKGSHIWKTADAEIGKRMRRLAELDPPRSPAKVTIEGRIGEPLTVSIMDVRSGKVGSASSLEVGVLEEATGSAINAKSVSKAIGTLGNSQWSISELDVSELEEGCWCPMSWIKDARRRALEDLADNVGGASGESTKYEISASTNTNEESIVDQLLDGISLESTEETSLKGPKVSVLARSYDQIDAICTMMEQTDANSRRTQVSEVIVDLLEIEGIRSAVSRLREVENLRVIVASPRVIKPGEEGIWRTLLKTQPDGILVRSTGLLYRLSQLGGSGQRVTFKSAEGGETIEVTIPELIGDFSLNAANAITAFELLQSGLGRITASYDLSANAITELATLLGKKASQLEVVLHQHMPIFHTEHCVFARFLSKGNSYQDCGHVCTRNTVHLRDQSGKDNLVLADMGCRNTVFMAESQSGIYNVNEWVGAGVGHLRIELVDEHGDDAVRIVSSYLDFLDNEKRVDDVWDVLGAIPDSNGRKAGIGVGSLRNSVERRSGELSTSAH